MVMPNKLAQARLPLLAVLFVASAAVFMRAIATPKPPKGSEEKPLISTDLPASVPLTNWQQTGNKILKSNAPNKSNQVTGRSYEYRQGNKTLRVDVRPQYGDSNIGRLLAVASEVEAGNAKLQPKYQAGLGNYGVLAHNGRLYLTACINSRGESTLTNQQFQKNQYSYDLQPSRILPWVLGQKTSVFDERCLWTLMSVPLPPNAEANLPQVKEAYQSLESAWEPIQQWWQANFPAEL